MRHDIVILWWESALPSLRTCFVAGGRLPWNRHTAADTLRYNSLVPAIIGERSLYIVQGMLSSAQSFLEESRRIAAIFRSLTRQFCFASSSVGVPAVFSMHHSAVIFCTAPFPMYSMTRQAGQESHKRTLARRRRGTPTWTRMSAMLAITISAKATAMTCSTRPIQRVP